MEAVLHGWDGSQIALPQVIQWKFQYGLGTPCDSFEVRCLWEPEEDLLAEAVRFTADEGGQRVFTGLVDECERGWAVFLLFSVEGWRPGCWTTRPWAWTTRWPPGRTSCGTM